MRKVRCVVSRSILSIVSLGCVLMAQPHLGAAPQAPPGPVEVQVKRADNGAAVAGAFVRIAGRFAATGRDGTLVVDGIPEGDCLLAVEHPGFYRVSRQVILPAGKRDPIEVALVPVRLATVRAVVTTGVGGHSVAGARVQLTPVEVAAAVHGVISGQTDFEGVFAVSGVPPGRYAAEVSAAGCAPFTSEVVLVPEADEIAFTLTRETSARSLHVLVVHGVTEQPIEGARVAIAEAWPAGIAAEATTGRDGLARLEGIPTGRLNRAGEDGRMDVVRTLVTVRAEAEGCAAMTVRARMGVEQQVKITLAPLPPLPEAEPNAPTDGPQEILPGQTILTRVHPVGDIDGFRFHLNCAGRVTAAAGPNLPIAFHLTLLDPLGKTVREVNAYAGAEARISELVPAGNYLVLAEAWGQAASETEFPVQVSFEPCPDAFEPSDGTGQAREIRPGEEVRGWLLPAGDVDTYSFELERPGWVRLVLPPMELPRNLRLLDQRGEMIQEWNTFGGAACVADRNVPAGRYYAEVTVWGTGASTQPYLLELRHVPDDGLDDPPPGAAAVRSLSLPGLGADTVLPNGDRDAWLVPIPGPGRLTVALTHPAFSTELFIRGRDGRQLATTRAFPGAFAYAQIFIDGPDTMYVEVGCWGDNASSTTPYSLTATFESADELDFMGRNDSPDRAVPMFLGEAVRGSIMPIGDADHYRFTVDHPGWLGIQVVDPAASMLLRLSDDRGRPLGERTAYAGSVAAVACEVLPGEYRAEVRAWGDNQAVSSSYLLTSVLHRAEPEEIVPLDRDPVRSLELGVARPCTFDLAGDVDRFVLEAPREGTYSLRLFSPINVTFLLTDDRTAQKVAEGNRYGGSVHPIRLDPKGPTRYRLTVQCWGAGGRTHLPGYVLFREGEGDWAVEELTAVVDPLDPTRVTFSRQAYAGLPAGGNLGVDADGRGGIDLEVPAGGSAEWRYPAEGVYPARAVLAGPDGTSTVLRTWVVAEGPRERRGVVAIVDYPTEGGLVIRDEPVSVRAMSWTGTPIASVSATLDGAPLGTDHAAPFRLPAPWRSCGEAEHLIVVTARDRAGEETVVERRFKVSSYFDLLPEEGAVVTGNHVPVSWRSGAFLPTGVRYRKDGETQWQEAIGESGRDHRILLGGLEAGIVYEYQPLGGEESGPIRRVTRVKGLAFDRPVYGATIHRDYDQRVPIRVRNHAEKPQTVRLVCGRPEDERLLVGFVGEGSEDAPQEIGPGEEREFVLALSAQDVITPEHRFSVRLTADSGVTDEAAVEVFVRLPEVELSFEDLGPVQHGLGRHYRLKNEGDTLTDLAITSRDPGVVFDPAILHGMLLEGRSVDFTARPELHEGFEGISTELVATAVGQEHLEPFEAVMPEGQKMYQVLLVPGLDPEAGDYGEQLAQLGARLEDAGDIDAAAVDWSQRTAPEDTDGDGRIDRWSLQVGETRWVGDDTTHDGSVDFAHADVGGDGVFEYSAFLTEEGWQATNMVDAWLEMGFSLPLPAYEYHQHDVDIVLNDVLLGSLKDTIPEGGYAFRVPPRAIRFGEDGKPEDNQVEIKSQHLRGGHYAVNSDFRFTFKLTPTAIWSAGATARDAYEAVLATEGLDAFRPDFSVIAPDVRLSGPPTLAPGQEVFVEARLRNLGSFSPPFLDVALMRAVPEKEPIEISRVLVEDLETSGSAWARLPLTTTPGVSELFVMVDPDDLWDDLNPTNNNARLVVRVAGEDAEPTLAIALPEDGARLSSPIVPLKLELTDDTAGAMAMARIDGGLWKELPAKELIEATLLLQAGDHTVTVRVVDAAGHQVEKSIQVSIDATSPEATLVAPPAGQAIDARQTEVQIACPEGVILAAARAGGGPWRRAEISGETATVVVPLRFGEQAVEALIVDSKGAARLLTETVRCTRQAEPDRPPDELPDPGGGRVTIEGLGTVDLFEDQNALITEEDR